MRYIKILALLAISFIAVPYAHAQYGPGNADPGYAAQDNADPGYSDPGYAGPAYGDPRYAGPGSGPYYMSGPPVCPYGYYDYYP
jgi:hypothetical protein